MFWNAMGIRIRIFKKTLSRQVPPTMFGTFYSLIHLRAFLSSTKKNILTLSGRLEWMFILYRIFVRINAYSENKDAFLEVNIIKFIFLKLKFRRNTGYCCYLLIVKIFNKAPSTWNQSSDYLNSWEATVCL